MNARMRTRGLATLVAVLAGFGTTNGGRLLASGTATATMAVSATVVNNCTITTSALSFGTYDPLTTHSATGLDGTGSVTITCSTGSTPTVGISTGVNASGSARRLASGSNYLTYELYSDSGRATVWGNSGADLYAPAATPSRTARTFTVYGRVSGGQDVPAGVYTDTVTATVNF